MFDFNLNSQQLTSQTCCNCAMQFAVPTDFNDRRLKDGKNFYCPNGHAQHYQVGKTAEQKLQDAIAEQTRLRERIEWERSQRKNRRTLHNEGQVSRDARARQERRLSLLQANIPRPPVAHEHSASSIQRGGEMTEAADIQRLQAELRTERAVNFAVGVASFVAAVWVMGVLMRVWWR